MRQYSKEEIAKIVSDCSDSIMKKNSQDFTNEALKIAKQSKSNNEILIEMFVLLYSKTQENCCDTIIEVLNRILN